LRSRGIGATASASDQFGIAPDNDDRGGFVQDHAGRALPQAVYQRAFLYNAQTRGDFGIDIVDDQDIGQDPQPTERPGS
jgi:hypothetical protein